jgi:hypothetical protein
VRWTSAGPENADAADIIVLRLLLERDVGDGVLDVLLDMPELEALKYIVATYPAIDNHAHPLLDTSAEADSPFESLVSEAQGPAAAHAPYTLAAFRATRQLAELYDLDPISASWEDVETAMRATPYDERCRRSFAPTHIQCLLLDDGLATAGAFPVSEHDQFTHSPSRRIVRVEVIAQNLLRQHLDAQLAVGSIDAPSLLDSFTARLDAELDAFGASDFVAGFKSIVCYRTGLAVALSAAPGELEEALTALGARYTASVAAGAPALRLQDKPLNDLVVRAALRTSAAHAKPLQFHTGLGDADLLLTLSSPALLQPIIRANPAAPIVLLHGAYPHTRDAAYLAAMYANVWLDLGEVWPYVSTRGQTEVVCAALELCPVDKLLWSCECAPPARCRTAGSRVRIADAHTRPESYYLCARQSRDVLYEVRSPDVCICTAC